MAVTDLTNTTWVFNENIEDYELTRKNINFTSNGNTYSSIAGIIMPEGIGPTIQYDYDIVWSVGWFETAARTITITGGTDVTNVSLIAWLEANATQQTSTGKMYIGNLNISKMYIGNAEVSKVYLGQDLVYEKQSVSTISFTIQGTTYQAEDGMTWAEWVASAYNTNNFVTIGANVEYDSGDGWLTVGYVRCGSVGTTDAIQADRAYVLYDAGTCMG